MNLWHLGAITSQLRALLPGLILTGFMAIAPVPAQANCAGFGRPPEIANAEVQQRLTPLIDSTET
jgi:hypothetical protein